MGLAPSSEENVLFLNSRTEIHHEFSLQFNEIKIDAGFIYIHIMQLGLNC